MSYQSSVNDDADIVIIHLTNDSGRSRSIIGRSDRNPRATPSDWVAGERVSTSLDALFELMRRSSMSFGVVGVARKSGVGALAGQ